LQQHNVRPESGPVVVTGATGGVGVMAVKLLAKLGYTVVAASGKRDKWAWLQELGASQVVSREDMVDDTHRPLLSARWAGAVDTVGGRTLATLLKSTRPDGCVTACGLVGGSTLPTSVFPFILRGVVLAGICAAWCPRALRLEVWHQLAGAWRLDKLSDLAIRVPLEEIGGYVTQILAGEVAGRVVVDLRNAAAESHGCHTVTCGQ
jgi:putative YhdH/YhfP family quinone oxidoreductase